MVESQADFMSVLEETLLLAQADSTKSSESAQCRLEHLLSTYFQEDPVGAHFRSMICYGCGGVSVSLVDFNTFIVAPQSKFVLQLHSTSLPLPIRLQRASTEATKELRANTLKQAQASVQFMLQYVSKYFFAGNTDIEFFSGEPSSIPATWISCIITGLVERPDLSSVDCPLLADLQHRIIKSLEYSVALKLVKPRSRFFSTDSAVAWKKESEDTTDYDKLYLKACSDFPEHLADLLGSELYLDELAGVEVSHSYPEVEQRFQLLYEKAPPRSVQGVDLQLGKDNVEIGGTVVALHQYLSPKFLAYYTVDHDASCSYMRDERSEHKKERKIRVASMDHVDTKPTWLQFGDSVDVYLYLSQKASAAEEKWLFIVNYVMNLLVEMVNSRVKATIGGKGRRLELMRKRDYRVAVGSASNPLEGNYGKHGDAKNGIVIPGDIDYSTYQLMVPTLCIQNYAHANTKIQWSPVSDPSYTAGVVTQECVLFHIQLLNVNELFQHWVSNGL